MITYQQAADRTGTNVPDHLAAQAEIPLADPTAPNRQGDVYLMQDGPYQLDGEGIPLDGAGYKVVRGEADRNSHILNDGGQGARFHPSTHREPILDYGILDVPDGAEAVLTHTAEHGSIRFGPGQWRVWGQASFREEMRRASD